LLFSLSALFDAGRGRKKIQNPLLYSYKKRKNTWFRTDLMSGAKLLLPNRGESRRGPPKGGRHKENKGLSGEYIHAARRSL
jgi:hypothetical protein